MGPVLFDYDKCNNDGLCADVCPRKLIALDAETARPETISEVSELCINCGHCLAVCPAGAIALNGVGPEDCTSVAKEKLPVYDPVDLLMKSRRSIRVYKDEPLDGKIIEQLLDTCRYAPSGSNSQPVHWIVASGGERLNSLAQMVIDWMDQAVAAKSPIAVRMHLDVVVESWKRGEDRIFRSGPAVIMTHAPEFGSLPSENCVIAMTFLDLAAAVLGLGTCWVGYLMLAAAEHPPLIEALGIPQDHCLSGAMIVGYPKYTYRRIPPRNPLNVSWL